MTVPTFLGIGVPRGGTTWLHTLLAGHPDVNMPTRRKEVRFFDRHYDLGRDWYEEFFCPPEDRSTYAAIGEISPQYLYCEQCPDRILATVGDVKLMLTLRHPVDRAYSQYGFNVQRRNYRGTFGDFVASRPSALEKGFYSPHVKRYLERFDRRRILPLVFEEIFADTAKAREQVADFLGVAVERFPETASDRKVNASTVPTFGGASGLAVTLGRRLRRWKLESVVDLGRRLGIQRAISRGSALAPLGDDVRRELGGRFAHEFDELERCLGIDLSRWRD